MSKSGKKKITSVFRDYRATKCSLFFVFLNEMDKYIRLDITCRMFFFELIQKSKENIMKQLTRKKEKKKKKKPVIHPASTLST